MGREADLKAVTSLLRDQHVRLVTLTGPGGVGKTRLALQLARDLASRFADGAHVISLEAVTDPEEVPALIADALQLTGRGRRRLRQDLRRALGGKDLLLVLDNFEQVMPAADLVGDLLASDGVRILVTSRAPLHLSGEHEYLVAPLAYPPRRGATMRQGLARYPAIALFLDRARALHPDFDPTPVDVEAIAAICRRLEGVPLAIELVAVRLRLFSPAELAARLDRPLALLTGGAVDLPIRQRTLRNTIEWSYGLLSPAEQRLLRSLAVFPSDFSVEAAEAVGRTDPAGPGQSVDSLTRLVEHNVLRRTTTASGAVRLGMYAVIREVALERLEASGQTGTILARLAAFFLALAQEAEPHLRGRDRAWLNRLEMERDNLRAAARWYLDSGQADLALRLIAAVWRFFLVRGYLDEGRRRLDEVLAAADRSLSITRATALHAAGALAAAQGEYEAAARHAEEALAGFRELKADGAAADALETLASITRTRGDYAASRSHVSQALALYEGLDDRDGVARSLLQLGALVWFEENDAQAWELAERALGLFRQQGKAVEASRAMLLLGLVALNHGDETLAEPYFRQAHHTFRSLGDQEHLAASLYCLALVEMGRRNQVAAHNLHLQALTIAIDLRLSFQLATIVQALGAVAAAQRRFRDGLVLLSAATAMYQQIGARRYPRLERAYQRTLETVRKALDARAFQSAWERGQSSTARDLLAQEGGPGLRQADADGLTPREVEVLRLVATGLTNGEVATRLFLSLRTIHAHLRSIYRKLGVSSRSAATRYAVQRQLI